MFFLQGNIVDLKRKVYNKFKDYHKVLSGLSPRNSEIGG